MPRTAKELGMKNNSPDENLRAGTKYLNQIYARWSEIPDSIQRLKFTLASYNCGIGHVQDAQRLSASHGGDKLVWDDNVEESVLKLSHEKHYNRKNIYHGYVRGREPYNYVREIFERYDNYIEFVEE